MNNFALKLYVMAHTGMLSLRDRVENNDRGATAVEYGLMVGLIAVAIIGAVSFLSKSVQTTFNKTGNAMNNVKSS